jgi:acyl dehydratase
MAATQPDVAEWVGRTLDAGPGDIRVERGFVQHWCEAVQNANPLFWDDEVAQEATAGPIAPPTMLSVWMRPLAWRPGRERARRPLELHFQLKEAFDLPEGIVAGNEIEFGVPVRLGDVISTTESIREISEPQAKRLGTGRFWIVDVTYTNQHGEVVGVETYRMFAYRRDEP